MLGLTSQKVADLTNDTAAVELYRLLDEGYQAIQDGRTSTLDEVKERIRKRREGNS